MTDRELLRFAAKAAGIYLEWDGPPNQWQPMYYKGKTYHSWKPLVDDGDAMRLAVKLRMWVIIRVCYTDVMFGEDRTPFVCEKHNDDPYAATRRAIVMRLERLCYDQRNN